MFKPWSPAILNSTIPQFIPAIYLQNAVSDLLGEVSDQLDDAT